MAEVIREKSYRGRSLVFILPILSIPLAARILAFIRKRTPLVRILKALVFGLLQDAAILMQTTVLVLIIYTFFGHPNGQTPLNNALSDMKEPSRIYKCLSFIRSFCRGIFIILAYFIATLPCLVDLGLQIEYQPRLNFAFIQMGIKYAAAFQSSIMSSEVWTPKIFILLALYIATSVLWTYVMISGSGYAPDFFRRVYCDKRAQYQALPTTTSARLSTGHHIRSVLLSPLLRNICLAAMLFICAVNSTVVLDGNGGDIYLYSNVIFSMEADDFLQLSPLSVNSVLGVSSLSDIFLNETMGDTELYEFPTNIGLRRKYPFWRKTIEYIGEKRFQFLKEDDNKEGSTESNIEKKDPPDIIIFNMESWRSLEIGVLGGRDLKAKTNQTVTPNFDKLAEEGILFRQHYTPAVQTSRTIVANLFGILPSLTKKTAIAQHKTRLRMTGIPHLLKELNYESIFWSATDLNWEGWRKFLTNTAGFDRTIGDTYIKAKITPEQGVELNKSASLVPISWGSHDPVSFTALDNFLTERSEQKLEANATRKPLFLNLYTISTHDPWTVPAKFTPKTNFTAFINEWTDNYCTTMNYADEALGNLIKSLRSKQLLNNTIIIIQGDHGYGRMEHENSAIITSRVFEEGTHVPFLLLADGLLRPEQKGKTIDDLTSSVDLLATIADLVNLKNFNQHSIGQSMRRKTNIPGGRSVVLENPFEGGTRGIRFQDFLFASYATGDYEIYNVKNDVKELHPIETGQLVDNDELGNHKQLQAAKADTKHLVQFMNLVINTFQALYENNTFQPFI